MNKRVVSIWEIPNILMNKMMWIIISVGLCGGIMLLISGCFIRSRYTSEVSIYVYSNTERTEKEELEITSIELTTSQQLVETYIVILQSDSVMNKVIDNLNLSLTSNELRKKVSAASVNNTEILSIKVEDIYPERAQKIANEIAYVLPEELVRVVKAGGAEIIDYAKVSWEPSYPNKTLFVFAGLLFGFFMACGIIILLEYFDTKIKGEQDLNDNFGIPVLGVIPVLESVKKVYNEKK